MGKIINIDKINRAVMEGKDDLVFELCKAFDHESYFDPVFDPPESFLQECRKYWEAFYERIMEAKPDVPTFYAVDENNVVYFYHGKTRIRVSEHFPGSGKSYGEIAADTIRYVAGSGKKVPLSPAC